MYDGCIDGGGCPGASLAAARDQAILDGVDAINYSIGSGSPSGDPYNDLESLQWLAIREAGIFAATSAGNTGPGDATAGSPGDLPWIITVGPVDPQSGVPELAGNERRREPRSHRQRPVHDGRLRPG